MEDESRAVCVSMCLFVFVSVCFCIYLLLSVYVFIATCVIVRLHCVIREPGGCEGGREQSRGGEELNQGFAERARENVGKESRREIQITYCEPWSWARLSEFLVFCRFICLLGLSWRASSDWPLH